MSALEVMPHPITKDDSLKLVDWKWDIGFGEHPITEPISGWDVNTDIRLSARVIYDYSSILAQTQLDPTSVIAVGVTIDCVITSMRKFESFPLVQGQDDLQLAINVPSQFAYGELEVVANLVCVGKSWAADGSFVIQNGARLQKSKPKVVFSIDDQRNRLSTDAFSFSKAHLPNIEWIIDISPIQGVGWEANISDAINVSVNTDHDEGLKLLDPRHPEHVNVRARLERELVTVLFQYASNVQDAYLPDETLPGSIKSTLEFQSRSILGSTLSDAIDLYKYDPGHFMTTLKLGIPMGRTR